MYRDRRRVGKGARKQVYVHIQYLLVRTRSNRYTYGTMTCNWPLRSFAFEGTYEAIFLNNYFFTFRQKVDFGLCTHIVCTATELS